MKKIIILIFMFFAFSFNINALCFDEKLNNWALDVKIEQIEFDNQLPNELNNNRPLIDSMNYAYILTLSKYRDDVVMKATNNFEENLEWMYIPGHKVWGIPNYNSKDRVEYDIKIYGAKNSDCSGEIIKTFKYNVEPFNFYLKTEYCEDYPEAPMCAVYKDTSDVSEEEFKEIMQEYEKVHGPKKEKTYLDNIFDYIYQYAVFILVPFVFISIFYIIRIKRVQREEKDK